MNVKQLVESVARGTNAKRAVREWLAEDIDASVNQLSNDGDEPIDTPLMGMEDDPEGPEPADTGDGMGLPDGEDHPESEDTDLGVVDNDSYEEDCEDFEDAGDVSDDDYDGYMEHVSREKHRRIIERVNDQLREMGYEIPVEDADDDEFMDDDNGLEPLDSMAANAAPHHESRRSFSRPLVEENEDYDEDGDDDEDDQDDDEEKKEAIRTHLASIFEADDDEDDQDDDSDDDEKKEESYLGEEDESDDEDDKDKDEEDEKNEQRRISESISRSLDASVRGYALPISEEDETDDEDDDDHDDDDKEDKKEESRRLAEEDEDDSDEEEKDDDDDKKEESKLAKIVRESARKARNRKRRLKEKAARKNKGRVDEANPDNPMYSLGSKVIYQGQPATVVENYPYAGGYLYGLAIKGGKLAQAKHTELTLASDNNPAWQS